MRYYCTHSARTLHTLHTRALHKHTTHTHYTQSPHIHYTHTTHIQHKLHTHFTLHIRTTHSLHTKHTPQCGEHTFHTKITFTRLTEDDIKTFIARMKYFLLQAHIYYFVYSNLKGVRQKPFIYFLCKNTNNSISKMFLNTVTYLVKVRVIK